MIFSVLINYLSGITSCNRIIWNVFGYYAIGSYHYIVANSNFSYYFCSRRDNYIVTDSRTSAVFSPFASNCNPLKYLAVFSNGTITINNYAGKMWENESLANICSYWELYASFIHIFFMYKKDNAV